MNVETLNRSLILALILIIVAVSKLTTVTERQRVHQANVGDNFDVIPETDSERFFEVALPQYPLIIGHQFEFCSHLENSAFHATLDPKQFPKLVDGAAKKLVNLCSSTNYLELKRLACYSAAMGNVAVANLSAEPLLHSISPIEYFSPVLPTIKQQEGVLVKPKFKLAYLVMVHEANGLPHLKILLSKLDDGDAIVLVHVDKRSQRLYRRIDKFINIRRSSGICNIHLAKYRFKNIWGHISLVFTQLSGFWELTDLATWDFVLNLSNYDYPLTSNANIWKDLIISPASNYIEYFAANLDLSERLYRPHVGHRSRIKSCPKFGLLPWPFTKQPTFKHHQWIILTYEYVNFMRVDPMTLTVLAAMEHLYIPDEAFFSAAIFNSKYKTSLVNDNKRFVHFAPKSLHPSWLGYNHRFLLPKPRVGSNQRWKYYFMRKFNYYGKTLREDQLEAWINTERSTCEPEDYATDVLCFQEYLSPWGTDFVALKTGLSFRNALNSLIRAKMKVVVVATEIDILLEMLPKQSDSLKTVLCNNCSDHHIMTMFLAANFSVTLLNSMVVVLQPFDVSSLGNFTKPGLTRVQPGQIESEPPTNIMLSDSWIFDGPYVDPLTLTTLYCIRMNASIILLKEYGLYFDQNFEIGNFVKTINMRFGL